MLKWNARVLFVVALALLLAPDTEAGAIVVGPTQGVGIDFTSIQAAVDVATSGDLILIHAGTYAAFAINNKGLSMTADLDATVLVQGTVHVDNLSADQSIAIRGIEMHASDVSIGLSMTNNAGPIMIEESKMTGSGLPLFFTNEGARLIGCSDVTFVECVFEVETGSGAYSGLFAENSMVSLWGCGLTGGTSIGATGGLPGAAGCQVFNGSLFASDCSFEGGSGGPGMAPGTFQPCTSGLPGGAGLSISSVGGSSTVGTIVECSFQGGAGGAPGGPGCSVGPSGPPTQTFSATLVTLPVSSRYYGIPSPVREGDSAYLRFGGEPNDFVFAFFSVFTQPTFSNQLKGTLVPGDPSLVLTIGQLPASGLLTIPVVVPIQPAIASFSRYEQALYYNPNDGFVLGTPRFGVVLDSSL